MKNLPDDLIGDVLSRLPIDERIGDQRVSKRWRRVIRNPAAWSVIDLRHRSEGRPSKILRYLDLAIPPSALSSASRLRFLGLNLPLDEDLPSTLAQIGRHPSAATVEQLALNVHRWDEDSEEGDVEAFLSASSVNEFFENHERARRSSFPSLKHLSIGRLLIDIDEALPSQDDDPEAFLAVCDRVVDVFRERPISAPLVRLQGVGLGGFEAPYPVDSLGSESGDLPFDRLLTGLCGVLEAASSVLAGSPPLSDSAPPAVVIDSTYLVWNDPSLWNAFTDLARGVSGITIEEEPVDEDANQDGWGQAPNSIRFSDPLDPPLLIETPSGAASESEETFTYAPAGSYKHYLHNIAQLIEEGGAGCGQLCSGVPGPGKGESRP